MSCNAFSSMAFSSSGFINLPFCEPINSFNILPIIKGSKTIQSKAEEKLRGDRTPRTVTSNFDDNAAMRGVAPLNSPLVC